LGGALCPPGRAAAADLALAIVGAHAPTCFFLSLALLATGLP
jgi:hypothetical protein